MKTILNGILRTLACIVPLLLTTETQAQLIYKTKFLAVEGYTNGWMIGQPSIGNQWLNANADWSYDTSGAYQNLNNGKSWWPPEATEPWYIVTATNSSNPGGGAMKIASDGNFGTNAQTYFWKVDFPTQRRGPITVTWDWQFVSTNEIPADYDPTNNNYSAVLPGFDHGFTLSDYANRVANQGDLGDTVPNPNWKYSELSTPFRLGTYQDARHNAIGLCGGNGDWNNYGPEFKDGKLLHMKLVAYVTNAPVEYQDTYEAWAQREGEDVWQTAYREDTPVTFIKDGSPVDMTILASGMRRCPGETDPESGINCLMLWMNGNQFPRYVLVSNIRVVGPDAVPVPNLKIERVGTDLRLTFDGWLEAADAPQGPYTTVAIQSPYIIPAASAANKFYRAEN
jgi:hypothetical protein